MIKTKSTDVKLSTYIHFKAKINDKDPKFKIGDLVRVSKNKSIFANVYSSKWSEEAFVIKEVQKYNTMDYKKVF